MKPKKERNRYAFWTAAAFTGLLTLAWLAYIPGKLDRLQDKSGGIDNDTEGGFGRALDSIWVNLSDKTGLIKAELISLENKMNPDKVTDTEVFVTEQNSTTTPVKNIDFESFFVSDKSTSTDVVDRDTDDGQIGSATVNQDNEFNYQSEEIAPTPSYQPRTVLIGTSSSQESTTTP